MIISMGYYRVLMNNILYNVSYHFVVSAVGTNPTDNKLWDCAHPIHLHDHSFHVAKIGFGEYNYNGKLTRPSEDILCTVNTYF